MRIWNLQSLLVSSIILWKSSLTKDDWFSSWRSWLPSLFLNWCLAFTHQMRWCVFWYIRAPWVRLMRVSAEEDAVGFTKRFPIYSVFQIFSGLSLRLGLPRERLPPRSGWGGKNTGWLVTWDRPLRTDSASWKSLESFIQLISFCSSWILPVSSWTVSRSSFNFFLEIVSNVKPWNRFNSSISLRLFSWASRRSRFCSNDATWRSCWSRRSCSSPW